MEDKSLDRIEVLSEKIVTNCKLYRENKNLNTLATLKSVVELTLKEMEGFVASFD
ncbi:MAG: hypothetical protein ACRDDK_03790 [Cetobacterium sp.]|uniref:hypothetical protein n=1 Tax=Cetobacterium sp. TaxID=2071632 RepID=UPI003EE57BEA